MRAEILGHTTKRMVPSTKGREVKHTTLQSASVTGKSLRLSGAVGDDIVGALSVSVRNTFFSEKC